MPLIIEDDILRLAGCTAAELRLELAIHLLCSSRISLMQASAIADLSRPRLERELRRRRVRLGPHVEGSGDIPPLRQVDLL